MFQYGQLSNAMFRIEHQHADGSWGTLEPEDGGHHHDPAEHDPEQAWQRGHIYVCRSCNERVRLSVPPDDQPTG